MHVLIVGGGSIGERHLRCFAQTGRCQVALCEVDAARRVTLCQQYGVERSFAALADAAGETWNAAVICTPAHLHVEHVLQLAPQTAAFLIEKPLATRLDEARRLLALAEHTPMQVAYVYRAHPAVEQVRGLLAEGAIGTLLQIAASSGQHFPTFRPAYRQIYYNNRATGGGAVQDAATHLFNLIEHLAGPFDWICCDYAHQALEDVEVEDTVHLLGRAGQRVLASVTLNQFQAPNETWVQLNGSAGSIRIHFHEHRYGVFRHGDEAWTWSPPLVEERDDLFRRQANAFLDVCSGQSLPTCNIAQALHTLRVNLAALESRGHRVEIEP